MIGDALLSRRAGDLRPPSIAFPVSANRNASMSDAHEVLRVLRDAPENLLSYESRASLHILSARTDAGLYEPDVVVEIVQRDGFTSFRVDSLRRMVVRTLEQAFPEDGGDIAPPNDQQGLLASLATLAALRTHDVESVDGFTATCWAPTPWCEIGVDLKKPFDAPGRTGLPDSLRASWSSLVQPALMITDRTQSDARLAIAMRPDMEKVRIVPDPMERLRLERDLAPLLANLDDEAAW
jgi:hypothetical protein